MRCVRIGFGKIARIHDEQLQMHGVLTVGILEVNPERIRAIEQSGLRAMGSLQEAVAIRPDFYDICTPTHARLEILRQLCALDPLANILIEKPICDFQDIAQIHQVLQHHRGRIVINENYASSNVTLAVQNELESRGIIPARVIIESTKNRGADFLAGRFIDTRLGALGYEGSHLLALIGEFGEGYAKAHLLDSDIDSIAIRPPDSLPQETVHLVNQGGAFMKYQAKNGCIVELYSSMAGRIGFPCPPYAQPDQVIGHSDVKTRYRILRTDGINAEGVSHQIIGLFEPVRDLKRSQGLLLVFKNWVLDSVSAPIEDNTMSQHLLRAIRFFEGLAPNPYSLERGFNDVRMLREWSESCWSNDDDSTQALGRPDSVLERGRDALRFNGSKSRIL